MRPVALVLDELGELAVRHRDPVDAKRGQLRLVRLELVVVGPRLVHGAEGERAARNLDLVRPARCAVGRRRLDVAVLGARPALQRLEHRLLRLQLVLEDEAEDEAVPDEDVGGLEIDALEHVERPLPHVRGVGARGRGVQRRELGSVRAFAAERVVDVVVDVRDAARARERAEDPELLEAGDMREAPDERRDARRDLRDEVVVRDGGEQPLRGRAPTLERPPDLVAGLHSRTVMNSADSARAQVGDDVSFRARN